MGKTYRTNGESKHPNRSAIPSNVARGMILGSTGRGGPMKDRRDKRSKDARRKREQFGEYGFTSAELVVSLAFLAWWALVFAVCGHFIVKCW